MFLNEFVCTYACMVSIFLGLNQQAAFLNYKSNLLQNRDPVTQQQLRQSSLL